MKIAAVVIFVVTILTGCTSEEKLISKAMDLRKSVLEAKNCTFQTIITADYGDVIYTFQMDCVADNTGSVKFTVTDPETISGITGIIDQEQSKLTFEDKVLAFPMLAENQITPVSAPWVFINTLRGGYLSGCSAENDGYCIYIDDSYEEYPLHLLIHIDKALMPYYAEIIWNERRILTLDVRNFTIQ